METIMIAVILILGSIYLGVKIRDCGDIDPSYEEYLKERENTMKRLRKENEDN